MEKYTKAQMEIIEFENEDVIMTSSIPIGKCPWDGGCKLEDNICPSDGDCQSVLWVD